MPQHPAWQRSLAAVQGVFYLATGIWPLLHMSSFLFVTGPKTDLWLVNTVGVLVAVSGLVLVVAAVHGAVSSEVILLAAGDALVLAGIDITYVLAGRISKIYLLDAGAELLLVGLWIASSLHGRRGAEHDKT